MMNRIKYLIVLGLIIIFISGCLSDQQYRKQEASDIQSYIASLGDTAYVLEPSGLYYIDLLAGTGRSPVINDTVGLVYQGMLLDRTLWNTNVQAGDTLMYWAIVGSNQLIAGLNEGVRYMKQGGKARFLTPSSLAYGAAGYEGIIPGYTPLLWEVVLMKVKPGPGK